VWRFIYDTLQKHFPAFDVDRWWGIPDPFARIAGSILVLLGLKGIGPETADTILAYVLGRPTISGDAYSRRLFERLTGQSLSYEEIRQQMRNDLQETEELQRLHGLIVEHGKAYCLKRKPRCASCLFADRCMAASSTSFHHATEQPRG